MKKFFEPFIGEHYNDGINGKKVLVLGASFYCDKTECPFFKECTSTKNKQSDIFDNVCPEYAKYGKQLRNEPSYCVEDANSLSTYMNFARGITKFTNSKEVLDVWTHCAFTNYIQHFLPKTGDKYRTTRKSDLSERDFDAFLEVVQDLQPDIVIIWGTVTNIPLIKNNPYVIDTTELKKTGGYVCQMQLPGSTHMITLLNPYHPSSSAWYSSIETFQKHLEMLLETTNKSNKA